MIQDIDQYLLEIEQQYHSRIDSNNNCQKHQEQEQESKKTLCDQLLEKHGEKAFKTLTRFDLIEFQKITDICIPHLHRSGKGKQFSLNPIDMLLVTFTFLTTGYKYKILSQIFHLDDSLICRTIKFTIKNISKPLVDNFCNLKLYLEPNEERFQNFPNAIGAIDTSFILIEKPGLREEQKKNWSYKHGSCGVKIQCLVRPNGLCTMFKVNVPGSIHDITIFKESGWLEKLAIPVQMPNGTTITSHMQVLFDKGYTGLNNQGYPEAIVTIKKPIGRELNQQEIEINHKIESDRVLVENYFGRMKTIFAVTAGRFRGERGKFLTNILETCIALTNYNILLHPLRNEYEPQVNIL